MIPLGPVVARSRLRAERTAAWAYLADAGRRAEWWPELRLDPRVGGEISERWSEETVSRDASGKIDVWVDGHAIGFTWREAGDLRDTAVLLTLRSQGAETGITVTETGFDALPNGAERAAGSHEGWQVLLRDLNLAVAAAADAGEFGEAAAQVANEEPEGTPAEAAAGPDQSAPDEPEAPAGAELSTDAEAEPADVDPAADAAGLPDDLNDTVRVERLPAPAAAAPGADTEAADPGASEPVAADPVAMDPEPAVPGETAAAGSEAAHDEAELDFDALIRGEHPGTDSR